MNVLKLKRAFKYVLCQMKLITINVKNCHIILNIIKVIKIINSNKMKRDAVMTYCAMRMVYIKIRNVKNASYFVIALYNIKMPTDR